MLLRKKAAKPNHTPSNCSKENSSTERASDDSSTVNLNKGLSYTKSDLGPYKAVVTLKTLDKDVSHAKPDIEVLRSLFKLGVHFSVLERISRNKWYITFANISDANNAITNRLVRESKFSIEIPWFLIYRKVMIKGTSVDVSNDELWKELKDSNVNMIFNKENMYRIKTRTYVNGEVNYVDSTTVKLSLRTATILSHVFLWRTRLVMSPYVPNIRQCFNCDQLNHFTKFYKNTVKCLTCGLDRHKDPILCLKTPCCINCQGSHKSLSKECPEIVVKKKTTELMAHQNIDYNTARRIILQGFPIKGQALIVRKVNNSRASALNMSNFRYYIITYLITRTKCLVRLYVNYLLHLNIITMQL